MAQFVLELPQELRERIETRSGEVKQKPERFVLMAIEQYLEDLEDARDRPRGMNSRRKFRWYSLGREGVKQLHLH